MQQVDRLQRAYHHLEMYNTAVIGKVDHIDPVDGDAVDLGFEFQHRTIAPAPFADIGEGGARPTPSAHSPNIWS